MEELKGMMKGCEITENVPASCGLSYCCSDEIFRRREFGEAWLLETTWRHRSTLRDSSLFELHPIIIGLNAIGYLNMHVFSQNPVLADVPSFLNPVNTMLISLMPANS